MISQLKFFDDLGNDLLIGIGYNTDIFPIKEIRKDGVIIRNYLEGKTSGIKWLSGNQEVIKSRCFFGYPSVDLNYIIAIYSIEDSEFPSPNNAVVYTANGMLHKVLSPPEFASRHLVSNLKEIPTESFTPDSVFFDQVRWRQNREGEIATTVRFIYNRDWFEERILDPETGELGECISSGKI
ncbi:hypothetical protein [Pontibacter roseus]|uniref:hypothetical protein n=1 Tax=Pontibacter roseus TaxID=336989 RepID=UPI000375E12E|nr:hypothetical protein [Pontibacter roseus]